jgi:diguanylate cyclase (GGDEF)-like protein/PAS domain S-box-containing protein
MASAALRILLIEDCPDEAQLVADLLARARRQRYRIAHVDRLESGLQRLASERFDVVLLDFSLPDSVGLATFERTSDVSPSTPIIVLTNLDDEELASAAVRDGAQDYLVKREVDTNLLERTIRYAIERKRAEEAVRVSEERYALAAAGASDGIWDWDLATGHVYYSPRWKAMLGFSDGEVSANVEAWFSRVHPDDLAALREELDRHLLGGEAHFEAEYRLTRRDGSTMWALSRGLAVRDATGRATRMAGSLTDITARKRVEEQLAYDAFHDALTELPNRGLFVDHLRLALDQSRRRAGLRFAVLFLDLDRFKNLNDSLGHSTGDMLLVEVAGRLSQCLRPGDTVARLGGDEFGILLSDVNSAGDAIRVAERVQEALREAVVIGTHEVFTTGSIGIAMGPATYHSPEEVLRDADTAMYRAKAAGRACYQMFDEAMHRSVTALLKLEMDLRRAVENNEFVMHYQPIISLEEGRTVGFEGLVRWNDPQRGIVYPSRFIAVAEETGLMAPIGWFALQETCRQVREWQQLFPTDPPLYASVNISSKLLTQPGVTERLVRVLQETGLPPTSLRLEITESLLMDHGELAMKVLSALRDLGIKFSVDDFGTGYSSLSYLQRFAYDTLKIDRSFIAGMEQKPDVNAIVRTIVGLGNVLGMNVVAEGVETSGQLKHLRAMNCPAAQAQTMLRANHSW